MRIEASSGWIGSTYQSSGTGYGFEIGIGTGTGTNSALEVQTYNEATNLFWVNTSGNGYLSGSWSSDEKLKSNIVDATYGLDEILQMQPREFTWKDKEDVIKHGFIAQEAETVMPRMVAGESGDEVQPSGSHDYKCFDYHGMTAILTKAVQELSAKNDALEAKVTALENA